MAKRRDVFILVPAEGRKDEATKALTSWLEALDSYPGYLGGAVLYESANELIKDTIVLITEFESTEASRATFKQLKETGTGWPFQPNSGGKETDDQGAVLYQNDGADHDHGPEADHAHEPAKGALERLRFDRGEGLFARLLHVHAEVAHEHSAKAAANA